MLIVIPAASHAAVAVLPVERDSGVVARAHLEREKREVIALGKALEHIEQLPRHAAAAAVGPHGDVRNVALVEHDLQARIADHALLFVERHQKGRERVVQLLGERIARPRHGEAGPLQLRHRVEMLGFHRNDTHRHSSLTHSLCLQPVFAPVRLGHQRHGEGHHALHLLGEQPRHPLRQLLGALDDQLVVDLQQ